MALSAPSVLLSVTLGAPSMLVLLLQVSTL
jgi:hypothetical protein